MNKKQLISTLIAGAMAVVASPRALAQTAETEDVRPPMLRLFYTLEQRRILEAVRQGVVQEEEIEIVEAVSEIVLREQEEALAAAADAPPPPPPPRRPFTLEGLIRNHSSGLVRVFLSGNRELTVDGENPQVVEPDVYIGSLPASVPAAVSGVEEREGAFFEVKVGQEIDPDNQEINEPYYPIVIRKSD